MSENRNIGIALRNLDLAIKNLSVGDAIKKIDFAIDNAKSDAFAASFLVLKGNTLWFNNKRAEAVDVLVDCCSRFILDPGSRYFLGQYCVELSMCKDAQNHLTRCIELSKEIGDDWYLDSAYLLHAYASAKVGDVKAALKSLEFIENDESMGWVDVDPPISKDSIRKMIGYGNGVM